MNEPRLRILVIEDDVDTRANLCDILELDDFVVETAATIAEALDRGQWSSIFAIILDRRLPDGSADEVLPELRRLAPDAAVLIVTGYADLSGAIAALRAGAEDYILKPVDPEILRASLARVLRRKRLAEEKREAEQALRQERDFAESLIQAAQVIVLVLDSQGRIVRYNPYLERLSGYALEEMAGRNWFETFLHDEHRGAMRELFERSLAGTAPGELLILPIVTRQQRQLDVEWASRLLKDADGQILGVLVIGHDVAELRLAQQQALQAERLAAIGEMVTGLAHESRNAFQRSQACLEMLAIELEDRPEALELVARIQKAQDHLHHLYEEVRSYAAPIRLHRRACDLADIWRETWAHLAVARREKRLELAEHLVADASCWIDPNAIEQVFRNVLENAIAVSPPAARVEIFSDEALFEDRPAVAIRVRDAGPGMSPEVRERVFEPFFTTKTRGTGLGMAIARRIVTAHEGSIAVGDTSADGTEIVIVLPKGAS